MAILTKTGHDKLMRKLLETGGLTPDMEKDIERLRGDFDEREGMLKRYGETYDGEDKDEYEWTPNDEYRLEERDANEKDATESSMEDTDEVFTPREEEKDWRQEYESLKKRYLDRFMGTKGVEEKDDEIMRDTESDVKRDGTEQTFEDLFERREG